jgi:hypothetical protein
MTVAQAEEARSETVTELRAFAAERGVFVSANTIRTLRRGRGHTEARERIERAARLIDFAALELGIELSYRTAALRLASARQDLEKACARLHAQVSRGELLPARAAGQELASFAAGHGVKLANRTARQHAARDGDPREQIRSLALVLDEASKLGLNVDERSARGRIVQARGDTNAVIAKLRRQATSRRRRASHYCHVPHHAHRRLSRKQLNDIARCSCSRCVERLVVELQAYTRSVVRAEAPRQLPRDDAVQEARIALIRALDDWTGHGDFTAFYGTLLGTHFTSLSRWFTTEGRGGEQPLSLDAEVFAYRDGGRVDLIETIPDRTMDTLRIVLIRESIGEYLAAADDEATRACIRFETRQAIGD